MSELDDEILVNNTHYYLKFQTSILYNRVRSEKGDSLAFTPAENGTKEIDKGNKNR